MKSLQRSWVKVLMTWFFNSVNLQEDLEKTRQKRNLRKGAKEKSISRPAEVRLPIKINQQQTTILWLSRSQPRRAERGKPRLPLAFANYLSIVSERKVNVFDFDYQKSFFNKWKEDEYSVLPKLYDGSYRRWGWRTAFYRFRKIIDLKESKEIYLFDLAGTLDQKYSDLLIYSDFIIIPFEYSDVSVKSTLVFKTCWDFLKVRQSDLYSFQIWQRL